ncbi:MAG: hypothetical protein NC483_06215 [Ruminococcus sp.]|nr:hypothetical protein [Ruminococcus sp.]
MDFEVVIIGSDVNAYYMARNTYEAYHKKAYLIGKTPMAFISLSKILNITYEPDLWDKDKFVKTLTDFAKKHSDKKLVLIGANDTYVRLIVENASLLPENYVFNTPSLEIINNLLIKENFYENYGDILDIPKTYIYKCLKDKLDMKKINSFMYPLIVKPSNGILYHELEFPGQAKVYKVKTEAELKKVIKDIENSGYNDNLIIQEFIPGDDSRLFDCILYVGKDHKVKVETFAQIGLQEHTKTGIGNLTLLINGYNEFGNTLEIAKKLKDFLESINYSGIAEFDLKYDIRDNKFKVFEINPRQARSSYYLTPLGANLVKLLVDELIFNKDTEYRFLDEEIALTFVPKKVIKNFVTNEDYKNRVLKLFKEKRVVNPLRYSKDLSIKRRLLLIARDINYFKKYQENEW